MTVIHLDERTRDCVRCGFTMPLRSFPRTPAGRGWEKTCRQCLPGNTTFLRIVSLAVDMTLRAVAAGALLRLGYTRAAALVLDYRGDPVWPRLERARAMQRRSM